MTKILGADKDEQPHVYRAQQARHVIANSSRLRFVFWWECAHARGGMADYVQWHTDNAEDAQHIIFSTCGITSVGQLEDQWLPWKKRSDAQKQWDKLCKAYLTWRGDAV